MSVNRHEVTLSVVNQSVGHAHGPPARCGHCTDVIGVYEPLVVRTEAGARVTSLAAEPHLFIADEALYHRECYELTAIDGSE